MNTLLPRVTSRASNIGLLNEVQHGFWIALLPDLPNSPGQV
jgi:hypothetical protein